MFRYVLGIAVIGFAVLASARPAEPLPAATPESQGVSSEAILRFVDACERTFDGGKAGALHGFVILRHGKVIAEGSWKPFNTLAEPHMLYSHSKSFTSTAVGLVVEEGKLDLDERVVDIFPDKVPAKVSENLAQLRVRDLLTMNDGKRDHLLRGDGDWVREFLAMDFVRRPGTGFKYDSDATYMLAAIVERKTGRKLMDYLKEKLFDKIGITTAWSTTSPQGIPCGGWGMNMTTRELARFGQLYLNRGRWNGEYVFSPSWADLATARHTWSGWINVGAKRIGEGTDWEQGYGFQFWRCTRDGAYRADGAYGQLTVVLPKEDMVVSVHAGLGDMQKELNLIWDHLAPAAKDAPLAENAAAQAKLRKRLATLAVAPVANFDGLNVDGKALGLGRTIALKENSRGFRSVRIDTGKDGWMLALVTRAGEQRIPLGCGKWAPGVMRIDTENYEGLGAYIGEHKTMASFGFQRDASLKVKVYLPNTTGHFDLVFRGGRVEGEFWAMNWCRLESADPTPREYAVAVLGDTHFDAEPDSVYHSHYQNEGKPEWLWKVQRQEFARNGEMWRDRCRRLLAASAKVAAETPSTAFVLQLGDVIQGDCDDVATHKKMLDDCIKMLRAPYPKGLPFLTVVGNHDFRGIGAEKAYFEFAEAFLTKELGQPVKYPAFSCRRGPDLWVFCHFEKVDPAELVRLIERDESARHVFLVSHGPFTPGESGSWTWRLGCGASDPKAVSRLMLALLKRRAVVLSGHTHQIAWWRVANASGSYSEFTCNSVWKAEQLATAEPLASTPAQYGEQTAGALRKKDAARADAYLAAIRPYKLDLKDYFYNRGAGHFRLNVGERKVTMDYFPGDATSPARTFVLKEL